MAFKLAKLMMVTSDEGSAVHGCGGKAKGIGKGELLECAFETGNFLKNRIVDGIYNLDSGFPHGL
ncbi:MAG: hypothetical protein LBU17_00215 [Treponema sp.]|nr:hypothetical protein [Treponema sp.]